MVTRPAFAKINLFLHVLAREARRSHQIETLFCRIELADSLQLERANAGIELKVEGADLGPPGENLVWRAAELFHQHARIQPSVRMVLLKRIPAGAGLGGGSSDAAAALLGLNELHGKPLNRESLLALGARLGSDVPFFLAGAPLALAWGRGERLLNLPPLPPAPVLIVAPPQPMPTAQAYRALAAHRDAAGGSTPPRAMATRSFSDWSMVAELAANDFEAVSFERITSLPRIRDVMREAQARIALLCGSGSAFFGIFERAEQRDDAMRRMSSAVPDARVFATRTQDARDVDRELSPV